MSSMPQCAPCRLKSVADVVIAALSRPFQGSHAKTKKQDNGTTHYIS